MSHLDGCILYGDDNDDDFVRKYFPKYCEKIELRCHNSSVRAKVKQIKILKNFHLERNEYYERQKENNVRMLFQTNRKTLKSFPRGHTYGPDDFWVPNLYFPRIKYLDLSRYTYLNEEPWPEVYSWSLEQKVYRICGYFWASNRSLCHLKLSASDQDYWIMIFRKLSNHKQLLSSLENFELSVWIIGYQSPRIQPPDLLIELLKKRVVLECITRLSFGISEELDCCEWELIQSIIDCCQKLTCLSFWFDNYIYAKMRNESFSLNLSCLENLKTLDLVVNNLRAFIKGVSFAPSILEMRFIIDEKGESIQELFGLSQNTHDGRNQDIKEWEGFETHKILYSLFDKWSQLVNLKVLEVRLLLFINSTILLKNFILPLLRATPQLESFDLDWSLYLPENFQNHQTFDLDVFFKGIKCLKSLNLKMSVNCERFVYDPHKISFPPNLASMHIVGKSSPDFNIQKLLKALSQNMKIWQSVHFSELRLYCAQDLILLLKWLHSVSQYKTAKVDLKVKLFVNDFDDIVSNFRYPIYLAQNTQLELSITFPGTANVQLTVEDEKYIDKVFGQLQSISIYEEISGPESKNKIWERRLYPVCRAEMSI